MSERFSWRRFLGATGAAIVLGATGCAIDQKHEVSLYRQVIDQNKPAGVHIDPGQVITLTDALKLANQNEEKLSLQGESYLQALVAKDVAFSAFLPTISLGPSYTLAGSTKGGGTSQTAGLPIVAQINGFNPYRDFYALKSADATIEQQKQLIFDVQQTVFLDVVQTYYQTLTDEQSVEVLTNSLTLQQANLENMQAQEAVGTARPLDVAQAQAEVSQTQVTLNQSRANVRNDRAMLVFLVDAPIGDNPVRDDYEPPADIFTLDHWLEQGEAGRQDLLAANAAVNAARQNVEVAWGQYYPTLNLGLSYGILTSPGPAGAWNLILSLSQPLYDAGLFHAEVRNAWSLFRQAALTQIQLRRQIDQQIETAYIDLQLARQQLLELQVEVKAAKDAYDNALAQYQQGSQIYLNVLTALNTLLTSQLQLTTEQFAQKTAYFNLLRNVGELNLSMALSATRPSEQQIRQLATQPSTQSSEQQGLEPITQPSTEPSTLPSTLP
jgi:outer membrane protein